MSELKPYLVDVPVRVNVWIREECQRKQFEVLKQARPSIMFLVSDGGRNEKEWEAIKNNRAIFDNEIDWDCTVYKIYEDKNNGLYTMSKKGAELIWSKVDRCIFLEDDHMVSVSYFKYCAELLEKYKDDMRIVGISSMNFAGEWKTCTSDYFFCERGAIWGFATWKRSYDIRDKTFEYGKDPYVMKLLKENTKHVKHMYKGMKGYAENNMYGNHTAGGEFFNALAIYSQNQLMIIPKYNMMCNMGCTQNGAHADEYKLLPRVTKRLFNMDTYELEFPLKHPKYVIPDQKYRMYEEKVLGRGRPLLSFFRRIERIFLILKFKGIKGMLKKIKNRKTKKNRIEK